MKKLHVEKREAEEAISHFIKTYRSDAEEIFFLMLKLRSGDVGSKKTREIQKLFEKVRKENSMNDQQFLCVRPNCG